MIDKNCVIINKKIRGVYSQFIEMTRSITAQYHKPFLLVEGKVVMESINTIDGVRTRELNLSDARVISMNSDKASAMECSLADILQGIDNRIKFTIDDAWFLQYDPNRRSLQTPDDTRLCRGMNVIAVIGTDDKRLVGVIICDFLGEMHYETNIVC